MQATCVLLQSEKELQSGGEIKELADAADKLSKWLIEASIQELAQEGMEARLAAAQAARDQSQAAVEEAGAAVEAAERELAGAQAGDGRDESNRSLQERLADAQNAQARLWLLY
ncbi:hypothetical protein ABBQ38_002993 [Trebouxia sp. C0009 RCD-2024]